MMEVAVVSLGIGQMRVRRAVAECRAYLSTQNYSYIVPDSILIFSIYTDRQPLCCCIQIRLPPHQQALRQVRQIQGQHNHTVQDVVTGGMLRDYTNHSF
jgi:hypothetical protein